MATKTITVCDACGRELTNGANHYVIESKPFTDAAGSRDWNEIRLDFCDACTKRLVVALERVAAKAARSKEE